MLGTFLLIIGILLYGIIGILVLINIEHKYIIHNFKTLYWKIMNIYLAKRAKEYPEYYQYNDNNQLYEIYTYEVNELLVNLAVQQTGYEMRLDTGHLLLWPLVLIYELISYIIQKRNS